MGPKVEWLIGLVVAFGLGAGTSAWLTFNGTTRLMVDRAVEADAAAVHRYVDVLEAMRAEDAEGGIELLEAWLDDVPRSSSRAFVDDMVAAVWAAGPPGQLE